MSNEIPSGIPRRVRVDLCTPAEQAIRAAVQAVEEAGAHPLLTEAVVLLNQAREKVADYVDIPEESGETVTVLKSEYERLQDLAWRYEDSSH